MNRRHTEPKGISSFLLLSGKKHPKITLGTTLTKPQNSLLKEWLYEKWYKKIGIILSGVLKSIF